MSAPEPLIKKPGRPTWAIPVNDRQEFWVTKYDDNDDFLVWFTGSEDSVAVTMDRGGLRAMRSLIDMVDLVLDDKEAQ